MFGYPLFNPERNLIDGAWHRIKENRWTYENPVNHITTFCGLEADEPPYGLWLWSGMNNHPEAPQCEECHRLAWQMSYDFLMSVKP